MRTRWSKQLNPNNILQEYPRPQLKRSSYLNLNGIWQYTFTTSDEKPKSFTGDILVPFSPESELSMVNRGLMAFETLWYSRYVTLPNKFMQGRLLLHFGAVDQDVVVYCNNKEVGTHQGGYNAFTIDVSEAWRDGKNHILLAVKDVSDTSWKTKGKQKTKRGGIWYTPQSGIWQTVWLESVPNNYIQEIYMTPNLEASALDIVVKANTDTVCKARVEGKTYSFKTNTNYQIPIKNVHLWSPEDPFLYPIYLTLDKDEVESYFAMRSTCIKEDQKGIKRLFLNGKPYFHNGLLDQGYWPDGLYTAVSDEALIYDIKTAKELGFNMLRKHIKVEPMRWYYHCDRLGMLVWQDMPNGGGEYKLSVISSPIVLQLPFKDNNYKRFAREEKAGRDAYYRELEEMIKQLYNCPSIVLWVPFNEGWGQFDAKEVMEFVLKLDKSRPIDHASGWYDQKCGELISHHVYFKRYKFRSDSLKRAVALSEFGGYNLRIDKHCYNNSNFGYKSFKDVKSLTDAYELLYKTQIIPNIAKGLCACVYTQLTDVEDEVNGLITYDREVIKINKATVQLINKTIEFNSSNIV